MTGQMNGSSSSSSSRPPSNSHRSNGPRSLVTPWSTHDSHALHSTDRSLVAFQAKVERIQDAKKQHGNTIKAKKKAERVKKQRGWCHSMKQAQIFLGLRSPSVKLVRGPSNLPTNPSLDSTPAPLNQFHSSVVFISIDLEMLEYDARIVTEIGISVLDTLNLQGIPSGHEGRNWFSKFQTRHLRISQYRNHINRRYVQGCPDKFRFGESEIVSLHFAMRILADAFEGWNHPPFPAHHHRPPPSFHVPSEHHRTIASPGVSLLDTLIGEDHHRAGDQHHDHGGPTTLQQHPPQQHRNIVLVGHDLRMDLECLHRLGFDPTKVTGYIQTIDTADLWRAFKRDFLSRNLEAIMADLGLQAWDAHNAGNDAAYTLQALIVLAFRDLNPKVGLKEERAKRIETAVKELRERMWDEGEGWSSTDEEGDDGDDGSSGEYYDVM